MQDELFFAPKCSCGSDSVAPAVHTYRGPYFCARCCNYLDEGGELAG